MRPTSIRLSEETLDSLDGVAHALGRSRQWVIQDAIAQYLKHEIWFRKEVGKGLADIEAGRTHAHDEVVNAVRKLGIDVE